MIRVSILDLLEVGFRLSTNSLRSELVKVSILDLLEVGFRQQNRRKRLRYRFLSGKNCDYFAVLNPLVKLGLSKIQVNFIEFDLH